MSCWSFFFFPPPGINCKSEVEGQPALILSTPLIKGLLLIQSESIPLFLIQVL